MTKRKVPGLCRNHLAPTLASLLLIAAVSSYSPLVAAQSNTQATAAPDAATPTEPETWNVHGQFTNVTQKHGPFKSPYAGNNSLPSSEEAKETVDATLFLGVKLWSGGELYLNPELDQGFGFADTLGLAGFANGAAYKVGQNAPYFRLPRAFVRQTFALGAEQSPVESGANTLAGPKPNDSVVLTAGKLSVTDLFDGNKYAHDTRADFMNWSVIEGGAFDYAADSWGFTWGGAAEWTQGDWTLRGGVFAMSTEPNNESIDLSFRQRQWVAELEHRHQWNGHPGSVRLLGFVTQARMASYQDAVAWGLANTQAPDPAQVRTPNHKTGLVLNADQELSQNLGAFARFSRNDGHTEAYDFTDINQSVSAGLALKGGCWGQPAHALGLAVAVNSLSSEARAFFAAGGMGILVGDGQLPHYASEQILESYYKLQLNDKLSVTGDFQYVRNPAYNADRGPVAIVGLRLHAEF